MTYEPKDAPPTPPAAIVQPRPVKSLDGLNYEPSKGYMPSVNPKTDDPEPATERMT